MLRLASTREQRAAQQLRRAWHSLREEMDRVGVLQKYFADYEAPADAGELRRIAVHVLENRHGFLSRLSHSIETGSARIRERLEQYQGTCAAWLASHQRFETLSRIAQTAREGLRQQERLRDQREVDDRAPPASTGHRQSERF
jgi:flagellar biosynthesis chaperone FliJ